MVPRPDDASPDGDAPPIAADALIIGAGPVGLFQVFELGLLDIRAHVVDSLPRAGGQPVELYPDKPIYDIPGTQVCTGRELADALLRQIAPFAPAFHLGQEITQLEPQPDGRFLLASSAGTRWLARSVFIAAGVGAFQPRALKVAGAAAFEGTQIVYRAGEPAGYAGRQVVVHGGEDAALEAAIALARQDDASRPACVTLLHRRDVFQAAPETVAALRALREAGRLQLRIGQITGLQAQDGRLTGLQVTDVEGITATLPADTVIALLGLSPRLGPVAQWGLAIERKQLRVDTEKFATDVPGIFAVGDINTYPGKKKLILSGFHEAALAAFGAAAHLFPDRPVHLQYTTTSPRLHALLGVGAAGEGFDTLSPNGGGSIDSKG